ncbi:ATP-binding cassette domain-containing protein [Streptomyces sp. JJ38]|uniref:ATP-binding cassette domain-containing protein n=1 Tax=Streptomyces sp. JJ38 TaxID=2738128 RepID=UPI001C58B6F9|nr:ATP-binding cassette domain-containing protein [Streptomyces sp. JJ38]MBW1597803.1 ATP-binding cassette domain-containing protein [Streptomyces sp. JJ38]
MPLRYTDCTFRYRASSPVLDRVSLEFPEGGSVLLGPNGAGKSTLLALGASSLTPRTGAVTWKNLDSARRGDRREYRRGVGWLPQQVHPLPGLTVREQAAYAGWLKGLSKAEAWSRSALALARVRLSDLADRRSHELSGGQLRRLGIAQTLTHDADVILLDEPTAGLDPVQRGVFRELMGELGEHLSFIVSTHQTEDLLDVYESVVVLDRGRIAYQGHTDTFLALAGPDVSTERRAEAAYRGLVRGEA